MENVKSTMITISIDIERKMKMKKNNDKIKKCYTHKQVKIFSIYITGSSDKDKNKILKYI